MATPRKPWLAPLVLPADFAAELDAHRQALAKSGLPLSKAQYVRLVLKCGVQRLTEDGDENVPWWKGVSDRLWPPTGRDSGMAKVEWVVPSTPSSKTDDGLSIEALRRGPAAAKSKRKRTKTKERA